jgi:ABC-type transporter Mla maintaining outer membrane lipid asymmetry ATPase subunit MlaF
MLEEGKIILEEISEDIKANEDERVRRFIRPHFRDC